MMVDAGHLVLYVSIEYEDRPGPQVDWKGQWAEDVPARLAYHKPPFSSQSESS